MTKSGEIWPKPTPVSVRGPPISTLRCGAHLVGHDREHEQVVAEDADEVVLAGGDDGRHVLALAVLVDLLHEEVAHVAAREPAPVLLDDDLPAPARQHASIQDRSRGSRLQRSPDAPRGGHDEHGLDHGCSLRSPAEQPGPAPGPRSPCWLLCPPARAASPPARLDWIFFAQVMAVAAYAALMRPLNSIKIIILSETGYGTV